MGKVVAFTILASSIFIFMAALVVATGLDRYNDTALSIKLIHCDQIKKRSAPKERSEPSKLQPSNDKNI